MQRTKQKQVNPFIRRRQNAAMLRFAIQVIFFLAAPSAFSSAFAGVKEICSTFSKGTVLEWTSFTSMLVLLLVFTILCGRFFCGYACAFGAVGDWIHAISAIVQKKLRKNKVYCLPDKLVRRLQWGKYVVLAGILILCVCGQQQAVNGNSPWTVFSFLSAGNAVPDGMAVGVILLALIVCGMAVQERFFCQFLCPMGAVFSLLPVIPVIGQLVRNREKCIKGCRACARACPVHLELEPDSMRSGECIRCGKCANMCLRQNISVGIGRLQGGEPVLVVLQAAALLIGILLV
ncbi:MAG: 4Fe-4S binding protein [Butyricicoccus sp.]